MRQALYKLVAVLTLSQLSLVYGGGVILAYQEQLSGPGSRCARPCCRLAKAGSTYASACCAVRCGEDAGERGSEPARKRISLDLSPAPAVVRSTSVNVADSVSKRRLPSSGDSRPLDDGQPDLNVKHSVFLV
jgi:hypothetical protein